MDLAVPRGSVFGFLGRNGAGKTTTMRLLAGLASPTAGRAWIDGLETTGANRLARTRFGYLPQAPAFYSWMNAREYLDYVGKIQELPADARKRQIEELLELSDLKEASRRRIGGFSGGMLQRLGLAQALIGNPPVLLLDEPTSSLDPAGRYEVLDMITRISGSRTVFFSSHILNDIERVCNSLAVLHKGRLLLVSGVEELLEKYPVNAAELELDPAAEERESAALDGIPGYPPKNSLGGFRQTRRPPGPHHGPERSRRQTRADAADRQAGIDRQPVEWIRPTLEEIFLQMSS